VAGMEPGPLDLQPGTLNKSGIISNKTKQKVSLGACSSLQQSRLCCIFLRIANIFNNNHWYQLNIGITSVRNKVFFGARFYCSLLTLHVSAPFGGHLQAVPKHKKYLMQSLYIQRIR
jgi:hypothetical protein